MRVLFIHQNAPGQFLHLAPYLAADPLNEIVFLGERALQQPGRVRSVRYPAPKSAGSDTHPYLRRMEASVRRGQAVARACLVLREGGFTPDAVVAHSGWGETMFLRDVLPHTRVLAYCEMFYRSEGQDTGYVPELALDLDGRCRLRAWNADLLTSLETMDRGLSPTEWQRAQHPAAFRSRIAVVHEGVDIAEVRPSAAARFELPDGRVLTAEDEIVTFVARTLEPVRGFPVLLRALPELLRQRPAAQVLICGEDGVSYGSLAPGGRSWREVMQREVAVDARRVHFVGRLERPAYLALLQVSALHLYLSVPFVLSWSCIEALAAGCMVLASDTAPVREVIEDGVNGALTDARDPVAIARRATALLAGREGLGSMRARARAAAVTRFDVRRCLARQAQLVRDLIA